MSSIEYINSVVLTTNATDISFTNIPQNYQDLKIILNGTVNADSYNPAIRFNQDSSSNYSFTRLVGRPSVAESDRSSNQTFIIGSAFTITNLLSISEIDILSYKDTNINKTCLISFSGAATTTASIVTLWRSNSAINRIDLIANLFNSGNFISGTTATLWGVK